MPSTGRALRCGYRETRKQSFGRCQRNRNPRCRRKLTARCSIQKHFEGGRPTMFDLEKEVKSARRMKLRLGIVHYLRTGGGSRYLKMTRTNFRWPTDAEFYT